MIQLLDENDKAQIEQKIKTVSDETNSLKGDLDDLENRIPFAYNRLYTDIVVGEYIDSNGIIHPQNGWCRTGYNKVTAGEILFHNFHPTFFAFFNASKEFVSTEVTNIGNSFTVPIGVKYVILCGDSSKEHYITNNKENAFDYTVKPTGVYTEDEIDALFIKGTNTPSKLFSIIDREYPYPTYSGFANNSYWGRTDYVPVCGGEHLYHNFNKTIFAFYDKDKEFISQDTTGLTNIGTDFIVPEVAHYVVLADDITKIHEGHYISTRPMYDGQCGKILDDGYYVGENNYLKESIPVSALKKEVTDILIEQDYIECWGDSLTMQGGWTTMLKNASGMPLLNFGVGGESSNVIASRQGALAMMVNNITIPSSGGVIVGTNGKIQLSGLSNHDIKTNPLWQGEGGNDNHANSINPCYINGIKGKLTYNSSTKEYTFTREESGHEVVINRPTEIVTNATMTYNHGILVIFMGQNDTSTGIDDYIRLIKLMIQHNLAKEKKFVVIVRHTGTAESMETLEKRVVDEFGRNVVLLRPYMAQYGLADNNISPTSEDSSAIEVGSCPPSLLADSIHFNSYGKNAVGNAVIRKFKDLGYIN